MTGVAHRKKLTIFRGGCGTTSKVSGGGRAQFQNLILCGAAFADHHGWVGKFPSRRSPSCPLPPSFFRQLAGRLSQMGPPACRRLQALRPAKAEEAHVLLEFCFRSSLGHGITEKAAKTKNVILRFQTNSKIIKNNSDFNPKKSAIFCQQIFITCGQELWETKNSPIPSPQRHNFSSSSPPKSEISNCGSQNFCALIFIFLLRCLQEEKNSPFSPSRVV